MAASRSFAVVVLATAAVAGLGACAGPGASRRDAGAPLTLVAATGAAAPLDSLRAERDLTVLVFWSATCPCVRRYQQRVDALLDAYPADRMRVVGVSSNAGERFEDVLLAARERGVRIPMFRDEGGRVAEALGARSTPTVAVLDRGGVLRFLGWVDNERLPGDPGREPWLDRALEALLAGRPVATARTPVFGCVITRSLFDPQPACCTAH
jgi:hypothetical protein